MSAHSKYFQAHRRVDDVRGKARHHICAWCGVQAAEWSYDHRDENQREAERYIWSDDPSHYMPLCTADHRAFDSAYRRAGLAALDTATAPLKAKAAQRLSKEQKAWHAEQCERLSLVHDRVNAIASRERFARIAERRAEERAKNERDWARAIEPLDTLHGYFPAMVVLGDESHRMTGVNAYTLYEDWCQTEGFARNLGRTQFYVALETIPYITRKRTSKGIEFVGIRATAGL